MTLAIHVINGKVYLADYDVEKNMREVTVEEAVEMLIKAVNE